MKIGWQWTSFCNNKRGALFMAHSVLVLSGPLLLGSVDYGRASAWRGNRGSGGQLTPSRKFTWQSNMVLDLRFLGKSLNLGKSLKLLPPAVRF